MVSLCFALVSKNKNHDDYEAGLGSAEPFWACFLFYHSLNSMALENWCICFAQVLDESQVSATWSVRNLKLLKVDW